jgi:hypoxanthine phosphoribosyltransferase/predicted kinase
VTNEKPLAFISYIREDEDFAVSLRDWLRECLLDGLDFFVAGERESIPLGTEWPARVAEGLSRCKAALLIISPLSRDSTWISFEAGATFGRGVRVIPVCCKGFLKSDLKPPLSFRQAVELPRTNDAAVLLKEMAEICNLKAPSNPPPFIGPAAKAVPTRAATAATESGVLSTGRNWVSWDEIEHAATTLCEEVLRSGFEPDTIVGVGRGGAIAVGVVAARFRQRQGTERLIPVQLLDRRYLRLGHHKKRTVITGLHTLDVQERKVLVLNADSYTGTTLAEARDVIRRLSPNEVMTGALYVIKRDEDETLHDPEFRGKLFRGHDVAVDLPWRGEHYQFEQGIDTAELAQRTLIVLHGLVGTGKTSVTNAIVKELGCHPIHTDEFWFRQGLRGREMDPGVSAEHYHLLHDLCWSVIGSGRDVILDCTSRWPSFRRKLSESFEPWGVTLIFVSCSCSEASALKRIAQRKRFGPHDMGDEAEYRRVLNDYSPITEAEAGRFNLIRLDTDKLACTASAIHRRDSERVHRVHQAIEKGYLERLRG